MHATSGDILKKFLVDHLKFTFNGVSCFHLLNPPTLSQEDSAAAAAKSLQSCPILCYPIDGNPPGSPVPRILQARTLEWIAISFSNA